MSLNIWRYFVKSISCQENIFFIYIYTVGLNSNSLILKSHVIYIGNHRDLLRSLWLKWDTSKAGKSILKNVAILKKLEMFLLFLKRIGLLQIQPGCNLRNGNHDVYFQRKNYYQLNITSPFPVYHFHNHVQKNRHPNTFQFHFHYYVK